MFILPQKGGIGLGAVLKQLKSKGQQMLDSATTGKLIAGAFKKETHFNISIIHGAHLTRTRFSAHTRPTLGALNSGNQHNAKQETIFRERKDPFVCSDIADLVLLVLLARTFSL